jgi:uncharacterized protein
MLRSSVSTEEKRQVLEACRQVPRGFPTNKREYPMRNSTKALFAIFMAVCISAHADAQKIVKVGSSAAELSQLLTSASAVKKTTPIRTTTEVPIFNSKDEKMTSGLFVSTAGHAEYDSYAANEFIYLIEGSATLTSADGSVLTIKKGDALIIPKGWKGKWTTPGYKKFYVDYLGD